jgi:VWFA-related protein
VTRAAAVLALALAAASASAQQQPLSFPSGVNTVELDVSVTRDNRPAAGLATGDFEVKDSGVLQTVELVERSRARVHAVLLLDTSDSVAGEKLDRLTHAARAFVEGLAPDDAVTLLAFSYRVRLLGEAADTPASASAALARLAAGGTTALVDATSAALVLADPRRGRPLVLVFSDGQDVASWTSERQVLVAARHSDAVVQAIGFAPARPGTRERMGTLPSQAVRLEGSPGFLERLTQATGGRLWFADTPGDLGAAFQSVLEEVRERYLLRYEPKGVAPGGWHPLEVHVRGRGLTVRCRPGYEAHSSGSSSDPSSQGENP